MDELIKKILALPPITLKEKEWDIAASILSAIEFKTPSAFLKELKYRQGETKSILLKNKHLNDLMNYLTPWHELANMLDKWQEQLSAVWFNVFHQKLGADDLLPVTVELIPTDRDTLNDLKFKLEIAERLDCTSRLGYVLSNIHIAVCAKLESLDEPEDTDTIDKKIKERVAILREHLPTAAEEVTRQNQIHQLSVHCGEYKNHLSNLIKEKLKKEYVSIYEENLLTLNDLRNSREKLVKEDEAILHLIEINFRSDPKLIANHELEVLFDKFKAMFDLHYTCTRSDVSSEHQLAEFGAKFQLYQETLEKNSDVLGITLLKALSGYIILEKLFSLLPPSIRPRSTAERFNDTTESFAEKNSFFSRVNAAGDVLAKANPLRLIKKS